VIYQYLEKYPSRAQETYVEYGERQANRLGHQMTVRPNNTEVPRKSRLFNMNFGFMGSWTHNSGHEWLKLSVCSRMAPPPRKEETAVGKHIISDLGTHTDAFLDCQSNGTEYFKKQTLTTYEKLIAIIPPTENRMIHERDIKSI
jgi:hypothetical protein